MTQPPMPPPGPQQPQLPPDTGWLAVHLQGSWLTGMVAPRLWLNGTRMQASYGENIFPVPAGPWRVELNAQWMRTYGQATLDAQVAPGQRVDVWYAAPLHQFARGNIGFAKQKRPGTAAFVAMMAVLVIVLVLIVVLPVVAG